MREPSKNPGGPLAFFTPHFHAGGGQKVYVSIASDLAERGHDVVMAACEATGSLLKQLPSSVRVSPLRRSSSLGARAFALKADPAGLGAFLGPIVLEPRLHSSLRYLPSLAEFVSRERPLSLLSGGPHENVAAYLARSFAGLRTRLIFTEHNNYSHGHALGRGRHRWLLPPMIRRAYADAHAIVAVSRGVAADLTARTGIEADRIATVYNPVVPGDIAERASSPLDHPWFAPDQPPVVLGASRLSRSKDFPTLVRAFAQVRRQRPARLVILGKARTEEKTAKQRERLMSLAADLGVADDVQVPGFVENPFAYMARASVFVLSSIHEGFGNGLAEAMACGCPLVSTDCPSGPAEILGDGEYGCLVPVGDATSMAKAILETLVTPPDRDLLREQALRFSAERIVDRYEGLMSGAVELGTSGPNRLQMAS